MVAGRLSTAVFFIAALESVIMISPFIFFFYLVLSPVFRCLDHHAATRWLTGFFLPYLIFPPTLFLKAVRVLGSIFFLSGAAGFIICAAQIYRAKIFKRGMVSKGLYRSIRHPQYLSLLILSAGMAIMWPRFFVLASLALMSVFYYFLAKDEERRMSVQYGDLYRQYMSGTGMFIPRTAERRFIRCLPERSLRNPAVISAALIFSILGTGFLLRAVTLNSLPFISGRNVTLISMLPEDRRFGIPVLQAILGVGPGGKKVCLEDDHDYLGYLMPPDYIMQGMIAYTAGSKRFHSYRQRHTMSVIADMVLHPFGYLRTPRSFYTADARSGGSGISARHVYRRVIVCKVEKNGGGRLSGRQLLSFNAERIPVCVIDIDVGTREIVGVKEFDRTTAWRDIPIPVF